MLGHLASASTTGTLYPTSDGAYKQFLTSSGSTHYTLVDETACNTSDYTYTTTTTKRDSYGVTISSIGNGALISQVDIKPCASRQTTGTGTATGSVFYRYNGVDSADGPGFALVNTTPTTTIATTTFASLNLFKTSTSTLELGAVYAAGDKGLRLSNISTKLTYTLSAPSAPTTLSATNYSSTQNNLSWTDNSNNELEFQVWRAMDSATSYAKVATTTWNVVSFQNTGLTADHTYFYKVVAYNSAGTATSNSAWAITYSSAPTSPSNLTATTSGSNVVLAWTDNSKNEDNFQIERATDGINFSQIATTTLNLTSTTSYTDIAPGAGTFYYRVRAKNVIGPSSYSNTPSVYFAPDTVFVSGSISSATSWSPSHVYVINGTVTVNSGGSLTIQAGTAVKFFTTMSKLVVSGSGATLNAQGATSSKVIFTSYYDDSSEAGGDTNNDSGATPPAAGNWDDIQIDTGASATLTNAIVRYGSYNGCCWGSSTQIYNTGGNLLLDHVEVATGTTYGVYSSAGNTTVTSGSVHGFQFGMWATAGNTNVSATAFFGNSNYGLAGSNTIDLTLTDSTFTNNTIGAVRISPLGGMTFTHSGNSATGTNAGLVIDQSIAATQTWTKDGMPYIILYNDFSVPQYSTLSIDPGVIIKFDTTNHAKMTVAGNLNVSGDPGNKVYFTSLKDDSTEAGGDTNGDGGANQPAAGNWNSVEIDSGASATISNAVIRYGGYTVGANLYVNGGTLNLGNSEVANGTYYGVYLANGSASIASGTIHDHQFGIYASSGSLDLTNSTFYNNSSADTQINAGVTYTHYGNTFGGGNSNDGNRRGRHDLGRHDAMDDYRASDGQTVGWDFRGDGGSTSV